MLLLDYPLLKANDQGLLEKPIHVHLTKPFQDGSGSNTDVSIIIKGEWQTFYSEIEESHIYLSGMLNKVCVFSMLSNADPYTSKTLQIWICFEVSLSIVTQVKTFTCAVFNDSKVFLLT